MNLYEINQTYKAVLADLEAMDDISDECAQDTLEPFKDDLDNKCLAVAAFIKNLDAEALAVKDAESKLSARRKSIENKSKRMREYLAANIPGKLKDSQTTISPTKGRERVVVDNIDLLPDSCVRREVIQKAILAEVKNVFDDLPEGAAHIVTGSPSVTIR